MSHASMHASPDTYARGFQTMGRALALSLGRGPFRDPKDKK